MNEEVQFRRPELMPLSILRAVWKRKVAIAALFAVLTVASVVAVLLLPSRFEARALVLIEQQRIPERFVTTTVNEGLDSRLNRIAQELLAYEDLARMIEEFDLYADDRGRLTEEELVFKMRDHIDVRMVAGLTESRANATAFQISFEDSSAANVAQVANRLANNFVNENQRTRTNAALGTSEFIDSQIDDALRILKEQEQKLKDFRTQYMGELPEQERAVSAEISRRQMEYQAAEAQVARAHQNKLFLENNLEAALATLEIANRASEEEKALRGSPGGGLVPTQLQSQLNNAKSQYELLKSRYSENHPDVVRAKAYVTELEQSLVEAGETPVPETAETVASGSDETSVQNAQMILQAETRVKQYRTQLSVLDESIREAEARREQASAALASASFKLSKIPAHEQELASVQRDYNTAFVRWQELSNKSFDADLATTMEQRERSERFRLLDPARVPTTPVWPPRPLYAGAASLASLAFACLFGFALELKKNVVLGEWEMPPDIPVLGRIPVIIPEHENDELGGLGQSKFGWMKRAIVASSVLLSLVAVGVATSLYFGWISF